MATGARDSESKQPLEVVNFSHPLEAEHLAQIAMLTGRAIAHVFDVPAAIRQEDSLGPQAVALVRSIPFSPHDWQTRPIVVNVPGLAPLSAVVLAELHGRMGHFPAILRLRPEKSTPVTTYVVAEVINLQELRDEARTRRTESTTDSTEHPAEHGDSQGK